MVRHGGVGEDGEDFDPSASWCVAAAGVGSGSGALVPAQRQKWEQVQELGGGPEAWAGAPLASMSAGMRVSISERAKAGAGAAARAAARLAVVLR